MENWPIGVFASVDAGLGVRLEVARDLGVSTIQLHAPHPETRTAENAQKFLARLQEFKLTLTCVFCGFEGESYADIPTTQRTIGLVPSETQAERVAETKAIADYAKLLGSPAIGLHIGFIPHDRESDLYRGVLVAVRDVLDHCRKLGLGVHLETGQETAAGLLQFIGDVKRDNLFINFDPANMILYGTGEPIAALREVGKYVRSVHCKDGTWSNKPGVTWGQEVALGQGAVGFEGYLRTLVEIGYLGPLTIEREIPQDPVRQKAEIGAAVKLLTDLRYKILGE